ncbi:MAG: c-type cytochrome [Bdellovibrionota bacterium]|nr:c-type cytochrome [Bdellovibrionota bacterium]
MTLKKEDNELGNTIIEDEKHLVLDHDYDGIQELNHPLPSWWSGIWAISIVFAAIYFMYYIMMDGPTLRDEYKKEYAKVREVIDAEKAKSGNFDVEEFNTFVAENDGIKNGAIVYEENCLSCHAEGGGGDIGPNLTDKHWKNITAFEAKNIYSVVFKGVEDNGMPAWGEMLSKEELMSVVSFVMSLQGTTPPEAKEPEGELVQ